MLVLSFLSIAMAELPSPPPTPTSDEDAVAVEIGVKVEMPVAYVTGTVLDHKSWSKVVDPSALELALTQFNIDIGDADVVSVEPTTDGKRHRILWLDLGTGDSEQIAEGRGRRVCTDASRDGMWKGSEEIRIYAASEGGEAAVRRAPGMVVVDDHPTIGAMVAMAPGDVVTVRDVRRRGVLMRELVTVTRPSGELTLERNELRERMCWEAPPEAER